MSQSLYDTYALIRSDFAKRCEYEKKSLTLVQAIKFLLYPACIATVLYRFQHYFFQLGLSWVAAFVGLVNQLVFSVSIHSSASIGPRLMLLHASYILIGANVRIGSDCILVHNNSILPSPFYQEQAEFVAPIIGDDVILGGGAHVTGSVLIGSHTQISMNASVEESFDDGAVLFGVPARNLNKSNEATE